LNIRAKLTSAIGKRARELVLDAEGATLVEMSIVAPLLVLMFVTMLDFGLLIFQQVQVHHAAQAGAQYALARGYDSTKVSAAVTSATNLSGISATPAPAQFCGCPSDTGVTQLATGACTSAQSCGGSVVKGTYVTVSAQATYTPVGIVTAGSLFPSNLFSGSQTLSASTTVRLQ
jgi:Flp pilus assembly protein TadG